MRSEKATVLEKRLAVIDKHLPCHKKTHENPSERLRTVADRACYSEVEGNYDNAERYQSKGADQATMDGVIKDITGSTLPLNKKKNTRSGYEEYGKPKQPSFPKRDFYYK